MKKYFLYVFILVLIIVLMGVYYYNHDCAKIKDNISLQLKQTNGQKIDFSKLKSISFDKICFFDSYTPNEYAKSILGVDWDISKETSIADNDGLIAIVFLYKNKITVFCEYPLTLRNFKIPMSQCITQEEPVLHKKKRVR